MIKADSQLYVTSLAYMNITFALVSKFARCSLDQSSCPEPQLLAIQVKVDTSFKLHNLACGPAPLPTSPQAKKKDIIVSITFKLKIE